MPQLTAIDVELLKLAVTVLILPAGWFVGQRILVAWDIRKKRQELDVAAAETFQVLYGELKEVARLWRAVLQSRPSLTAPESVQWDLFARATAAENKFEALVIKVASERRLTPQNVKDLGLMRQACQEWRDSIVNGSEVPAAAFGGQYVAFNDLAAAVTCLLGSNTKPAVLDAERAKKNLHNIVSVRRAEWVEMVRTYDETILPTIRSEP